MSIHEFAHRALRFISWVDLFYHRVQSAVNVNGHLSSFFGLSHGIPQGCPLLLLHYALVSEVLVVNIHCNPHIPGLCLVSVFFCLGLFRFPQSPSMPMIRLSSSHRMMGLFRCLMMPWSMVHLPLMSLPPCRFRVPRPVTCSFYQKIWSLLIVWRSMLRSMVLLTGRPLDVPFSFSIWIVRCLI